MQQENSRSTEIVIISYLSATLVRDLLDSWGSLLPVCVVDNANGADGLAAILASRDNVRYIPLPGAGYARAANAALHSSIASTLVYANPDSGATLQNIKSLASGVQADPTAICHSALEQVGDKQHYAGGWLPSVRRSIIHALGLHRIFPHAGIVAIMRTPRPLQVHWAAGSLAAYKKNDLVSLGGFDENYYVYSEDMALGKVALERGLHHMVRHDVIIRPRIDGSNPFAPQRTRVQGASLAYYLEAHHAFLPASLCKTAFIGGFLGRALVAAVVGDRPRARAHMSFVSGMVTGRAFIDGTEVSASRVQEMQSRIGQ